MDAAAPLCVLTFEKAVRNHATSKSYNDDFYVIIINIRVLRIDGIDVLYVQEVLLVISNSSHNL